METFNKSETDFMERCIQVYWEYYANSSHEDNQNDWNISQNILNKMDNKDLKYWKENAEEDYINTPISVLRYISELEKGYSEKEVDDLLSTQRGNCYVAVLRECGNVDIAAEATKAPEPFKWKKA